MIFTFSIYPPPIECVEIVRLLSCALIIELQIIFVKNYLEYKDIEMKICRFNIMHSLDGENISSEDIKFHAYRVEDSTASKEYYQEMDDEEKIYVYIDEASGYIESNCSGLFTELALYKGISQYDYDNNTDKLIEYLTHCKDWEEGSRREEIQ